MAQLRKNGRVLPAMMVIVSLSVLGWTGYRSLPASAHVPAGSSALSESTSRRITQTSARAWLGTLGLELDALAAAGIDAGSATLMLQDLQEYLDQNGESFLAAIDAHNNARKQSDSDARLVRAGRAPAHDILTAHAAELATAATTRQSLQDAALAAASTHFSNTQVAKLAAIRANAKREVPAIYCLISRTDRQWSALREALAAERQSAERGEVLSVDAASLIANTRAEEATAAARSSDAQNRAALASILQ